MFRSFLVFILLSFVGDHVAFIVQDSHGQGCTCTFDTNAGSISSTTKLYSPPNATYNVVNPGRGFLRQVPADTSNFRPLKSHHLPADQSVVWRMYYMDTYLDRDLDETFIQQIKHDLDVIRTQGWTTILRFSYTRHKDSPAHDAGLHRILNHIAYLDGSHVFTEYEDVISTVQAGFIGVWGEWYLASDDFGIPGSCNPPTEDFHLSKTQWSARKAVLDAVLAAVPFSIDVQVRYPYMKYHFYGHQATTVHDLQLRNNKSRIGHHNDAFMSTDSNMGTYKCSRDKHYVHLDSQYTVVAGEANSDETAKTTTCNDALQEMTKYHWSMLNSGFKKSLIDFWKSTGCYEQIAAKLGYRLFLNKSSMSTTVSRGGELCYHIELQNDGFAAPYKNMEVHIVLEDLSNSSSRYHVRLPGVDMRTWLPGSNITLSGTSLVPHGIHGNHKVYIVINQADKMSRWNSKYYLVLANPDITVTSTRMNDLSHVVSISHTSCPQPASTMDTTFQIWQPPAS